MKHLLALVASVCLTVAASAMGVGITLVGAVRDADVIVHCRIEKTEMLAEGKPFARIAIAKVVTSAKGVKAGDEIPLLFDNGYGCPNVNYAQGEEVLVFARRSARQNGYETLNLYCGRFSVVEGVVQNAYFLADNPRAPKNLPLAEVIAQIEAELRKHGD